MPDVSRLIHMSNVQVVDFDVCRIGHPDKGRMGLLTNSLQVGQKMNRRCPNRRQHPAREADMKPQDSAGWAAVLCKGNPCRHRRWYTRRPRQDDHT